MNRKFAKLNYVSSIDEISFKFNILRKAPQQAADWYIKRFNPYVLEQAEILGESGYAVKIPVIEKEVEAKDDMVIESVAKIIDFFKDNNVNICLYPRDYPFPMDTAIQNADGRHLMPFFLEQATYKILKIMGKPLKTTEFLIIGGNTDLTLTVLDNIYPHVNFLSIMFTNEEVPQVFIQKAAELFSDTGLNLNLSFKNKSMLENADIIINTSDEELNWDYYFKRGAVYFDLGMNTKNRRTLIYKREDVLIADDLRVNVGGCLMETGTFELAFYLKSREYRQLKARGYNGPLISEIKQSLKKEEANFASLLQDSQLISSNHLTKFLIKATPSS